jgi:hypothetical protein
MKKLLGTDISGSWTFSPDGAGAGTIVFNGVALELRQILLINNATRNTIIYNFADAAAGAASYAKLSATSSELTLAFDTSLQDLTDDLTIYVDVEDELVATLQVLRMAVQSLTRNMGRVDTVGRLVVDANVSSGTLPGVTTVSTVTNQAQHGGIAANDFIPTITRIGGDGLRQNISVT